jgi:hypothetical protein
MAAFDFPTSPTVGQTYTANGITFTWDGESWNTSAAVVYQTGSYSDPAWNTSLSGSKITGQITNGISGGTF